MQIVSYTQGQYFHLHHDSGEILPNGEVRSEGAKRLFTFFLYLNDTAEGEGMTIFPELDLKIQPKRNKLLTFPNYLSNGLVLFLIYSYI